MGTSTSHRSPRTKEWRAVRDAYSDGGVGPDGLIRRILAAAGDEVRSMLADDAVRECVRSMEGAAQPADGEGLTAAWELRQRVQQRIASGGLASPAGEMALTAMTRAALERPAGRPEPRDFVAHLMASAVEHLVARDLTEHLGEGAASDATEAASLLDSVRETCLATVRGSSLPPAAAGLAESVDRAWSLLQAEGADAGLPS